ncbi:ATP-dependent DNA ligase [Ignicoccus hospitalis]|uniref:DNA ligase n=1 Tax=Ignicoccus hospitalis (strain KIN4/I / DSM 18386 / JCM 14125) TaxID=453591 RepID=DNLI_IGNH4|nr:ATP-dependent DNA ligase [Ignicoccus hospitalis]A8AB20.1 RecName: Full=DNA ligase; AltName: Full=Polydeoxyribonucleotide synthase [ATP] [Ignicoccus hospitalis KIN4/I]ABU82122.1 DNA ligase I, ATP-dependent Dnl1 [Ignicoccus hospitalis KIN4/I]HIH91080.1 ATP-dependent DNA ligase [Desulfurococcaceae archaeon]
MKFSDVVDALERLERTTSRTQIVAILTNLFKKVIEENKDIIDKVVYFIQGKLWPDWYGYPEIGIGEKGIIKAISLAANVKEKEVEGLYKQLGDLGLVAERLMAKAPKGGLMMFVKKKEELTFEKVYETLKRIAFMQGEGSRDLKIKTLAGLLKEASPKEAKYIVRFVQGKLRLGVGDASIIEALAHVAGTTKDVVERAYNLRADLGAVAKIAVTEGPEALKRVRPKPGVPVRPMLAERLNDPKEILKKLGGKGLAEYKYDGERAQIHLLPDGKVVIFSRRLENITRSYPDVVQYAKSGLKAKEAIVEGEIIAVNPETGEPRPFQELMRRRRKHDVALAMSEIPVNVKLFDIIYVDGEDMTNKPLPLRRKRLEEVVEESEEFSLSTAKLVSTPEELEQFFHQSISEGHEGLVVKAVHDKSVYQAGARGWLWIKYKKDYKSEMVEPVDLVVVGAFYGRGRRGGTFGALLVAGYDEKRDAFATVCKVGSGFSDEELARLPELLKPYISETKPPRVISNVKPDVWVRPALVAEIIGAEITLSPIHTCAKDEVSAGSGLAIRFPRFIRWRPDKGPEDATTCGEIVEMYKSRLKKVEEPT